MHSAQKMGLCTSQYEASMNQRSNLSSFSWKEDRRHLNRVKKRADGSQQQEPKWENIRKGNPSLER